MLQKLRHKNKRIFVDDHFIQIKKDGTYILYDKLPEGKEYLTVNKEPWTTNREQRTVTQDDLNRQILHMWFRSDFLRFTIKLNETKWKLIWNESLDLSLFTIRRLDINIYRDGYVQRWLMLISWLSAGCSRGIVEHGEPWFLKPRWSPSDV